MGTRIADSACNDTSSVIACVATESSKSALQNKGLETRQIDFDQRSQPLANGTLDTVYYLVPPPSSGVRDLRSRNAVSILRNTSVRHVVLISTTGVYGDCAGEWIDESRPLNPLAGRSVRRVDAENVWREWTSERKMTLSVLRVAGIYAADRLPEKRLRAGTPVLAEQESPFSNRIHTVDLVRICIAAAEHRFNGVLNVADDEPTTMTDYFFRVADALGIPRPAEISMAEAGRQFSDGMMSYLRESRRINNAKLKNELGIALRYPALADGLRDVRACLTR